MYIAYALGQAPVPPVGRFLQTDRGEMAVAYAVGDGPH
jgi:hypothetical protein